MLTLAIPAAAIAGPRDVRYAPPPKWVTAPPTPTDGATQEGAPVRIGYYDFQTRTSDKGVESYTAYRLKLLTPEALAAGNVSVAWNPDAGDMTVHSLRIIRGGQTIDVLKGTQFRVVREEANFDAAVLSGILTAVLQVPGLAVGDELEFAATLRQRDPTLGDRIFGGTQLPAAGMTGAFRARLLWPGGLPLRWRGTSDLGLEKPQEAVGGDQVVAVELRDPPPPHFAEGAPARVNIRRLIEYTDFVDWADVSHRMLPLFETAAKLGGNSPLRAEVAKIRAVSDDPFRQMQAALKFAQDQVRYVYVGLDGGNYRPAAVDETWSRRFGDCKAKTALLLAILKELGIEAEPVLVNSRGGDGFDQRLPNPGLFDHVLVRTKVAGKSYWLDGTRMGDADIDSPSFPDLPYHWVLPLRAGAVDLEEIPQQPPRMPQFIELTQVDARAGIDKPAKADIRQYFRGVEAFSMRASLAAMSSADADRSLKTYWRQQANWVDPDKVSWTFDTKHSVLTLKLEGSGKAEWEGEAASGRTLDIAGAGFSPPARLVRPKDQDQTAPWATDYPRFRCWATVIRLPAARSGWSWDFSSKPVDRTLAGVAYWRRAGLKAGVMSTVMSRRTLKPEIGATEAIAMNDSLGGFDNKISRVEESEGTSVSHSGADMGDLTVVDWVADPSVCIAPASAAAKGGKG